MSLDRADGRLLASWIFSLRRLPFASTSPSVRIDAIRSGRIIFRIFSLFWLQKVGREVGVKLADGGHFHIPFPLVLPFLANLAQYRQRQLRLPDSFPFLSSSHRPLLVPALLNLRAFVSAFNIWLTAYGPSRLSLSLSPFLLSDFVCSSLLLRQRRPQVN